ncbi:hypothetical protein [Aquimarina celericrescens]
MNYKREHVIIDRTFEELMIERCYIIDQYLIVRDRGQCYAELRYGKYTYRNHEGEFTMQKSLLELKRIFIGLINKYHSFEHEGYKYTYHRGAWERFKIK